MNSYNVNVRIQFEIPRNSHKWIVEQLVEGKHARKVIYSRYIKFVNSLFNTDRRCVRFLFRYVKDDVRSQVGGNMRRIFLDSDVLVIPGTTRPLDMRDYRVYEAPDGYEDKIGLLLSLIAIREDHFGVFFNEEDDEVEMEDNDITTMINDICTS